MVVPSWRLVMGRVKIDLENCYGIKKLQHEFDFSSHRVYAIYAPNGSMKSSLALTFKDFAVGDNPRDRLYPGRVSRCQITDENGNDVSRDRVVVLSPYERSEENTKNAAILLVNSTLREQYDHLHAETEKAKTLLIKELKKQSKSKRDVEAEISLAFTFAEGGFHLSLGRLEKELRDQGDTPYADLPYDIVFDDKVLEVLNDANVKGSLDTYISRYNELISASTYFRKGTFEYYNAAAIAKHLAEQGFFNAKHFVILNGKTRVEITSRTQLEDIIAAEKQQITTDAALRGKFDSIDKSLLANVSLRAFRTYVLNNEAILSQLGNVPKFKQEVWKSYLKTHFNLYEDLMRKHDEAEQKSRAIIEQARKEHTQWEQVIQLFNARFVVPFKLSVKNRDAVVIGNDDPLLAFTCEDIDSGETASVERSALIDILSQGEKKALYILDILFDVQVRIQNGQETLFIIDDIADSFDYRNKYAIIQYLMDIAKTPTFKLIILTHNFDFFRTACLRFVGYSGCLMASKSSSGLSIDRASGIKNPFVNEWKGHFFDDEKKRIASISFMRNLIEYTQGQDNSDFHTLTSLVHSKPGSKKIVQSDLDEIYKTLFPGGNGRAHPSPRKSVVESIHEEARKCLVANASANLEHKIVLSIAIRLAAEQFIIAKINDNNFVNQLTENQTQKLLEKYEAMFGDNEIETVNVLQRVALMVPENIHLNAFMYEPIVDMSDEHLKKLYKDVLELK
jgi:hypothetical protein